MADSGIRCSLPRLPSSSTASSSRPFSRPIRCFCPSIGSCSDDPRLASGEPVVIGGVTQGPVEPGRRDFQDVLPVDDVLDVENRAQLVTDALAVVDTDAALHRHSRLQRASIERAVAIEDDAEDPANRFAAELHVEHLETLVARHAFGDGAQAFEFGSRHARGFPQKEKVGTSPPWFLPLSWHLKR